MNVHVLLVMVILAAALGSCPFSVWIGRWLLNKNIRDFGDGNPGAWNAFRAGGAKAGIPAVLLDAGKGFPVIAFAGAYFDMPDPGLYAIGISAILGHAFSPFLHFRGGKAVAVTYGVMLALPQREILAAMAVFMLLGFMIFSVHAWVTVIGVASTMIILGIRGIPATELLFLLAVLTIFVVKNFTDLKGYPGYRGKFFQLLQAIRH